MEYSSFDIAKKFLEFSKEDNRSVDPMKLLKLVYIAHGWYLGFNSVPLISDEIQAWQYGPVIPSLYHVIKRFSTNAVDPELIDLYSEREVDHETAEFLRSIWNVYGKMNAIELSARTHETGTAWANTYTGAYHVIMSNEAIESHYKDLIHKKIKDTQNA